MYKRRQGWRATQEFASKTTECYVQICNHPCLSYWPVYEYDKVELVKRCGKFRMLDRLLVKLHASGHRVLLFSTMTKLLDLLEEYLRWREIRPGEKMGYLRIDGATSLEDRSTLCTDSCQGCILDEHMVLLFFNGATSLEDRTTLHPFLHTVSCQAFAILCTVSCQVAYRMYTRYCYSSTVQYLWRTGQFSSLFSSLCLAKDCILGVHTVLLFFNGATSLEDTTKLQPFLRTVSCQGLHTGCTQGFAILCHDQAVWTFRGAFEMPP